MQYAAAHGNVAKVREIIGRGCGCIDSEDEAGATPLLLASRYAHADVVRMLLAAGASVDAPTDAGVTPLIAATELGSVEVVRQLLDAGANVNAVEPDEKVSALMWAAHRGHAPVVAMLLAAGADARARSIDERDSIEWGADAGHASVVAELVRFQHGAERPEVVRDVMKKRLGNQLPAAARLGSVPDVSRLLKLGADPNAASADGLTALHNAAAYGQGSVVDALVRLVGPALAIDRGDANGSTPLALAARHGHLEIVEDLLALGADPNSRTKAGWTPLLGAALGGHADVARLLAKHGADVHVVAPDTGATALSVALERGHRDMAQALRELGATGESHSRARCNRKAAAAEHCTREEN